MDKRKNNGGNSTKSKGVDKRRNEWKSVLSDALTPEDLTQVIKMLFKKSIDKQDVKASQILLEYYLGKPKETIEATHNINEFNIKDIVNFKE
jgi:hypothetical protein